MSVPWCVAIRGQLCELALLPYVGLRGGAQATSLAQQAFYLLNHFVGPLNNFKLTLDKLSFWDMACGSDVPIALKH